MILFVTSDDGTLESYAALTRESKRAYCARYGYHYYFTTGRRVGQYEGVNPYWLQVAAMRSGLRMIADGNWINYTGADSFIVPNAGPCSWLVITDADLVISCDSNGLNTNGFFLRNCAWSREFLERVWAMRSDRTSPVWDEGDGLVAPRPNDEPHEWFEQAAFVEVLRKPGMMEHVQFVDQKFINAYPSELYPGCEDGDFIVHLPNRTTEQRTEYISNALKHLLL